MRIPKMPLDELGRGHHPTEVCATILAHHGIDFLEEVDLDV